MGVAKRGPYRAGSAGVTQRDFSITDASVAPDGATDRIIAIAVFGLGIWIAPAIYFLVTATPMTPAEWKLVVETFALSAFAAAIGFAFAGVRDVLHALLAIPVAMLLTLALLPPGLGTWLSPSASLNLAVVGLILAIAGAVGGWMVRLVVRLLAA